jgi:hypothetical protein
MIRVHGDGRHSCFSFSFPRRIAMCSRSVAVYLP